MDYFNIYGKYFGMYFSTNFFVTPVGEKSKVFTGGTENYVTDPIIKSEQSYIKVYLSQTGIYAFI